MNFKFIHAADIHLDSPLRGLDRYEGAPVDYIRGATRKAFTNLVNICIEEKVDFLLISGDLYDGDWKDFNTALFFNSQMQKLKELNIKVYVIRGNHDAASIISRELKSYGNVYFFSTDNPETCIIEELGVAIHGQGFKTRAVNDDLSASYPFPLRGYFNIGMLHTSAGGRAEHETYAPCSLSSLIIKGYDYWALGHIHKREILNQDNPCVIFSGNTQGRHINEEGDKGCFLVNVDGGKITSCVIKQTDVLRWKALEIDVRDCESIDEVLQIYRRNIETAVSEADGRLLAIRVLLEGATKLNPELISKRDWILNEIRSIAIEIGGGDIWIEKVKFNTKNASDIKEVLRDNPAVEEIINYMELAKNDDGILKILLGEFDDLRKVIPNAFYEEMDSIKLDDINVLKSYIDSARDLVLTNLLENEVLSNENQ